VPTLIQSWQTPVDGGGGNPGREYFSPVLGAGWTNLQVSCAYSTPWSGAFGIDDSGHNFFNRFPQPPSPFTANDPTPTFVTTASSRMKWSINNTTAGANCLFQLVGDPHSGSTFCEYGTRLKGATSFIYYLTPGLIDSWLVAIGQPLLAPLFTAFWYSTLDAREVCGAGPPTLPPVQLGTLSESLETLKQYMYVVAWPNICECIPGTPAPTPYPPPGLTTPPGWPAAPSFTCLDDDVCATLERIQQQLAALSQTMKQDYELVTLLQRYTLPFATVAGANHSGLSGSGSFAVSRLKGLRVSIRQRPPTTTLPGPVPYRFDLGWIAAEDGANVLVQEKRVSQDAFDWFPEDMQLATRFGYEFFPGVIADVLELQAER
jgi:hypothetical protein